MTSIKNIRLYLLPALCLSIMACTGTLFKNYGRIDPSREATRLLKATGSIRNSATSPAARLYTPTP